MAKNYRQPKQYNENYPWCFPQEVISLIIGAGSIVLNDGTPYTIKQVIRSEEPNSPVYVIGEPLVAD